MYRRIIALTRFMGHEFKTNHQMFRFNGIYEGRKIKYLVTVDQNRQKFNIGEEYLIEVNLININKNKLIVHIIEFKSFS